MSDLFACARAQTPVWPLYGNSLVSHGFASDKPYFTRKRTYGLTCGRRNFRVCLRSLHELCSRPISLFRLLVSPVTVAINSARRIADSRTLSCPQSVFYHSGIL